VKSTTVAPTLGVDTPLWSHFGKACSSSVPRLLNQWCRICRCWYDGDGGLSL